MEQLRLPLEARPASLRHRLAPWLDERMIVVETRNRVNLFSFRRAAGRTEIRISERLRDAPEEVLVGAVRWARGGPGSRRAAALVRGYVRALPLDEELAPPRLEARGRHHDLAALLARVREAHGFAADVRGIGWGSGARRRRRRGSVRLASFQESTRTIRVHPLLDHVGVELWVLEFLLFHELLHAELGATRDRAGRLRYHTAEFRARERAHPDHARFLAWEGGALQQLVGAWDRRSARVR